MQTKTSGLSGETMEWIARTQSFPNIQTLGVYLIRDDLFVERLHYTEHAVSFFRAFEPLEELSIAGPIDSKILDAVLPHHGQAFSKLSLRPFEETSLHVDARDLQDMPFQFGKDCIYKLKLSVRY